jgi:hypothetical protein
MKVDIDKMQINANAKQDPKNLDSSTPLRKSVELEILIEKCVERVLSRLENKC